MGDATGRIATATPADGRSFLDDLQFEYRRTDAGMVGEVEITDLMLAPGHDQACISVLATVADVLTGIPVSTRSAKTLALTTDLAMRVLGPVPAGTYAASAEIVKYGKTIVVTEARFEQDGAVLAHCWASFVTMPYPGEFSSTGPPGRVGNNGRLSDHFFDALGLRTLGPGVVEVDRNAYTLQPAGTLQGGVICAQMEAAVGSLIGRPVTDLDVRFLSAVRDGPYRASLAKGPSQ
jgi:acyl-coenzyme A thioesterase PaaI-like protein